MHADAQVTARARDALDAKMRLSPLRAKLWRHMGWLIGLTTTGGETDEQSRYLARADVLEEAQERDAQPIGRVLAAGVYHFVGKSKGLIHEVWAERRPAADGNGGWLVDSEILGNLTREMKDGVRNTFLAVREYARAKFPHRASEIMAHVYSYKVTKEDEPSGGLSAGLPTAFAFLSTFLQRPVPKHIALSGIVVADAHDVLTIKGVGDAEYKAKAAFHRNLSMLVLPTVNRFDIAEGGQIPADVAERLIRYASSLDEVVRLVFGEDVFVSV
jgi:hypothetical protein